jgi:hypothetical protein
MFLVVCSVCISNGRHPRAVIDAADVILTPETLAPAAERTRETKGGRREAGAAETVRPRAGRASIGEFCGGRKSLKWRVEDRGWVRVNASFYYF